MRVVYYGPSDNVDSESFTEGPPVVEGPPTVQGPPDNGVSFA